MTAVSRAEWSALAARGVTTYEVGHPGGTPRADDNGQWALPLRSAGRAAARISALHATGGLTSGGIFAVLVEAYGRVGVVPPPEVADGITSRICAWLAAAGVPVSRDTAGPVPDENSPAAASTVLDVIFWRFAAPLAALISLRPWPRRWARRRRGVRVISLPAGLGLALSRRLGSWIITVGAAVWALMAAAPLGTASATGTAVDTPGMEGPG